MTTVKRIIIVFVFIALLVASFLLIGRGDQDEREVSTQKTLTSLYIQDIPLLVEIADTNSLRQAGLSGKPFLERGEGMFFIFDADDMHGIWMKDMLFSIDIIWIDSNFNIVDVKESATPESFPAVFKPKEESRYVLEVNANFVEEHSIKIGDSIRFDMSP